ncbi:MAG: molybdopterin molybdotransferase MoeA, partial [Acidimicrobiales bacterium]
VLVPLDEVQALVVARCPALAPVEVVLDEALGCVLVEDLLVEHDVPPFANSAMDGFAVRAVDTADAPVELQVVGVLAAGSVPTGAVAPGEAIQIMTGAPIPPGADGIAIVERCEEVARASEPSGPPGSFGSSRVAAGSPGGVGRLVRVLDAVQPGAHVRPAGSDMPAGTVAIAAGTALGPADVGLAASAGAARLRIVPRPRVGVMSTGDELVEADGGPLGPGQIRDSNRHALLASLRRDGFEPIDLGRVADRESDVASAVERALASCDALITSGGVSKGEFDFVKLVLEAKAAAAGSHGAVGSDAAAGSHLISVAIRPAKPLALAFLPRGRVPAASSVAAESDQASSIHEPLVPVFGLPGNPVSSLVSYQVIALPGLRALAGHQRPVLPAVRATASEALRRKPGDGKLHLTRVRARWADSGRLSVASAGGQMSHQLGAMAAANALALLPDGDGVDAGDNVDVLVFGAIEN